MNQKKYISVGLLVIFAAGLTGALMLAFVLLPQRKEKKEIKTFFEEAKTLDTISEDFSNIKSSIDQVEAVQTNSNSEDILTAFEYIDVTPNQEEIGYLIEELKVADVPADIQDDVDQLIVELEAINVQMQSFSQTLGYLSEISTVFLSLSEQLNTVGAFDTSISENPEALVSQYELFLSEYNAAYDNFLGQLKSVSVPKNAEELHLILIQDFENLHTVVITPLNEMLDLLRRIEDMTVHPENYSLEELTAVTAEIESISDRMNYSFDEQEFQFVSYDWNRLFPEQDFDLLFTNIGKAEGYLQVIQEFEDAKL